MRKPKSTLRADETVIASWRANHSVHSQRALGGHLVLTSHRLIFEPHALDANLGGRVWQVPLSSISDVGKSPISLADFFGGGLRSRLRIGLDDGSQQLFVVNAKSKKADAIRRALPRR